MATDLQDYSLELIRFTLKKASADNNKIDTDTILDDFLRIKKDEIMADEENQDLNFEWMFGYIASEESLEYSTVYREMISRMEEGITSTDGSSDEEEGFFLYSIA